MADTKITALTSISTSTDPANDVLPIVDTSDSIMALTGTTKKVTLNQLLGAGGTASFATLAVSGATTLTGAATVQGLTVGKGASAISTNTAFGASSLAAVTASTDSTAFGYRALTALTSGTRNSAFGSDSLFNITIGGANTALGYGTLFTVVSGDQNTALGDAALYNATGSNNTGAGRSSLQILVAGSDNTAVGHESGYGQTAGSNNGFFGKGSSADSPTGDNQYNYGNGNVVTHKFRNGNLVVANGRIDVGGASAALRTSSSTADAFTTTVSCGVGVLTFFNTITIAFTVNNNTCTGIIDCQFAGYNQVWGDFLFSSNQTGIVVTMRSAASAGVTGVLTVTGSGTIYTLVITCPTTVQFPSVNLRVSSGGGAYGGSLISALPVVTFA